jgi:phenylpropionate dioxygenase-like ring-hydroxylating dioxygenase large terminal subunit
MNLQEQTPALLQRIRTHLAERTTDTIAQASRVPVRSYFERERYELEIARIFRERPLLLASSCELKDPGDFVTAQIAGVPIIAVRSGDGMTRAFINTCRHRGTTLVGAREGRGLRSIQCPYHAWTYDLTGKLLRLPHGESGFPDLNQDRPGLIELPVRTMGGSVWASREPESLESLDRFRQELDDLGFERSLTFGKTKQVRRINWKLGVDVFTEAYHFSVTHRKTIAPLFFDNLMIYDRYGADSRSILVKRSITQQFASLPESDWVLRPHANISYFVFPSTVLLLLEDHLFVIAIRPIDVAESEIETFMLIPEAVFRGKSENYWNENSKLSGATIAEDLDIAESIQRGLRSGANEFLTFGRFEQGLTNFHSSIADALKPAPFPCG